MYRGDSNNKLKILHFHNRFFTNRWRAVEIDRENRVLTAQNFANTM